MSTYSTRLSMGASADITFAFTAASGYVTVLRDVELMNLSGSSSAVAYLSLRASGSPEAYWFSTGPVAQDLSKQWQGRLVMNPGDVIVVYPNSNNWCWVMSGYQLAG